MLIRTLVQSAAFAVRGLIRAFGDLAAVSGPDHAPSTTAATGDHAENGRRDAVGQRPPDDSSALSVLSLSALLSLLGASGMAVRVLVRRVF